MLGPALRNFVGAAPPRRFPPLGSYELWRVLGEPCPLSDWELDTAPWDEGPHVKGAVL